jgi:hypothetical protein
MKTQRIVLGAVAAFVLAWGSLVAFATWSPSAPKPTPRAQPEAAANRGLLSAQEVARHSTPKDCWIVIRGKVYDVSDYIASHPAPARTITDQCGKESTAAFETKQRGRPHSKGAWQLLEAYAVGMLAE